MPIVLFHLFGQFITYIVEDTRGKGLLAQEVIDCTLAAHTTEVALPLKVRFIHQLIKYA
jgi:hypothetical protein